MRDDARLDDPAVPRRLMSVAAAHAQAFYDEVGRHGAVWTVEDDGGIPARSVAGGRRSMPFWSSRTRAQAIVHNVEAYAGMRLRELTREEFEGRWLPGLAGDGLLVGLNWSGARATGYDVEPREVLSRLTGR